MFPYMGGKSKQAKWINSFMPKEIDTYVEVFGGAFWVYINSNISCKKAIYNDIDPMMYNLWLCIKQYDKLIEILDKMEPQNKNLFVENREYIKKLMNDGVEIEEANFDIVDKYIYWMTHSFSGDINGGMSKVNNHIGFLNRLKKQKIQDKIDKVEVYNKPYNEIIEKYDKENTFFYIDPPYFGREHFYGFHPFTIDDHYNLSKILQNINNDFILSYYETSEIKNMYPENKFKWERKEYKRSSGSVLKGKKKEIATEVLIMKHKNYQNNLINQLFNF